jgi:predicted  nucleic acid-binding Zn-ribbon protein
MDRDYWRLEPTRRLIEEARTKGCELCRAIGERLEDAEAKAEEKLADAHDRITNLKIDIERLKDKLLVAERDLALAERKLEASKQASATKKKEPK